MINVSPFADTDFGKMLSDPFWCDIIASAPFRGCPWEKVCERTEKPVGDQTRDIKVYIAEELHEPGYYIGDVSDEED